MKQNIIEYSDMIGGHAILYENYFDVETANDYFNVFKQNINWKQEKMMLYGKEMNFARLTAWYGDGGKKYRFSGKTYEPNSWSNSSEIMKIKDEIEYDAGTKFNSVLLNYYRDGNDYISWHSDSEKELGRNPIIASVTFGCERIFRLRRYEDKNDKLDIPLTHGSLLVMDGATQHNWQHMIPKKSFKKAESLDLFQSTILTGIERINLTFRDIHDIGL